MRLAIEHRTTYQFERPMSYGLQQLRLLPKSRAGQTVLSWQMQIQGGKLETEYTDQHQNRVSLISFDPDATAIEIQCAGTIQTEDTAGVIGKHGGFAPLWYFQRATPLTEADDKVADLIAGLADDVDEDIPRLHALSARILEAVPYEQGATDADTTAEEALTAGSGVCQDHAHIFLAAARALGYPGRYVSGYLLMEDRVHQDASHAWAEAHVDGLGWVGFDVSNEMSPDERYVRVATGLDYREAAPVSGLRFGSGDEAMTIDIQVQQQ